MPGPKKKPAQKKKPSFPKSSSGKGIVKIENGAITVKTENLGKPVDIPHDIVDNVVLTTGCFVEFECSLTEPNKGNHVATRICNVTPPKAKVPLLFNAVSPTSPPDDSKNVKTISPPIPSLDQEPPLPTEPLQPSTEPSSLKEQLDALTKRLQSETERLEAELAAMKEQKEEARKEASQLGKANEKLQTEAGEMKTEKKELEKEIEALKGAATPLVVDPQESTKLGKDNKTTAKRVANVEKELAETMQQLTAERGCTAKLRAQLKESSKEGIKKVDLQENRLIEDNKKATKRVANVEKELAETMKQLTAEQGCSAKLRAQLKESSKEGTKENTRLIEDNTRLAEENKTATKRVANLEKELAETTQQLTAERGCTAKLRAQLKEPPKVDMEKEGRATKKEDSEVRMLMDFLAISAEEAKDRLKATGSAENAINAAMNKSPVNPKTAIPKGPLGRRDSGSAQTRSVTMPTPSNEVRCLMDTLSVTQDLAAGLLRQSDGNLQQAIDRHMNYPPLSSTMPGPRGNNRRPRQGQRLQQVFVIRHGERADDDSFKATSPRPFDPPLTHSGTHQARTAGDKILTLLKQCMDGANMTTWQVKIITSPYERCHQTAVQLASVLVGAEIMIHYGLGEHHAPGTILNKGDKKWTPEFNHKEKFKDYKVLEVRLPSYPEDEGTGMNRTFSTLNDLIKQQGEAINIFVTHGPIVDFATQYFSGGARPYSVDYCGFVHCTRPHPSLNTSPSAGWQVSHKEAVLLE